MGVHAHAVHDVLLTVDVDASRSEPFAVPGLAGLCLTSADLLATTTVEDIPACELVVNRITTARRDSYVIVFNTFYEMEPSFIEYWQTHLLPLAAWCVGLLCLAQSPVPQSLRQENADWLDALREKNRLLLYVAIGTQVELPPPQLEELAAGLESFGLDSLWVLRGSREVAAAARDACLEETAAGRGLVVREWVTSPPSSKAYLSPKLWYLPLAVVQSQDLCISSGACELGKAPGIYVKG